jgi:hypothetical protein
MNSEQIKFEIMGGNFTNDQLNEIADAVKYARAKLTRVVARSLRPGDTVRFTSNRNGRIYQGTLTELKIKNAIVRTNMGIYKVPMNMLEAI